MVVPLASARRFFQLRLQQHLLLLLPAMEMATITRWHCGQHRIALVPGGLATAPESQRTKTSQLMANHLRCASMCFHALPIELPEVCFVTLLTQRMTTLTMVIHCWVLSKMSTIPGDGFDKFVFGADYQTKTTCPQRL